MRSCIFKTYQEALKDISAILFRWYVLKQYQKVLKILNQYQKSTRRGIMRIYKIPRNKSSLRIIGELGDGKSDYRVNLFWWRIYNIYQFGDRFCRQNFESFRFVTSDRPNSDFSFQWFGHWNVFWLPVENFTINEFYDSIGNSDSGSPILKILIKFLKTIEILHFFR